MEAKRPDILRFNAECVSIGTELLVCLQEERVSLVALQADGIVQCNFRKENLGQQLKQKKRQLTEALKRAYGTEDRDEVAARLPVSEREEWLRESAAWTEVWKKVHQQCDENQRFIQHSLKNIGLIVDNLKRLLGENPTYSSAGKRVDSPRAGKVVEGSY